jgi:ribosomal-protein-alanine N-acetyltransferase
VTELAIAPLTPEQVAAIGGWRYPGSYATYDVTDPADLDGAFAVTEDGLLVGFCCFGQEARVPGVDAAERVLDVGYGMRPDLMGQGRGAAFVSSIVAFGVERFRPESLRLSICRWNERSRRAALRQGFVVTGAAGEFDVLERAI